ncbi:hypothetical protein UFOVP67_61 [uncultured Caudovirales phage]|uniref:Uncharacterized protein n=1 Tax=uncultured Caudovirales phage TaxID=2100421 RepID=A0A6J5T9Y2_9CAUD|nr:hypothetical protein UFOVP67_61 [uncultured Caudovirales phage]
MEELKAIFTIIKDLPNLAIWVFVIIYAYKVAVLGSIYGVIRYVVNKFVEWRKHVASKESSLNVDSLETADKLDEALKEYFGVGKIRESDVVKLAIVLQGSKK